MRTLIVQDSVRDNSDKYLADSMKSLHEKPDDHCYLCHEELYKGSLNKKKKLHTCKCCQRSICNECKGGRALLCGYNRPKCTCKACWQLLIPSFVREKDVHWDDLDANSLDSCVYLVAKYMYDYHFVYPYETIKKYVYYGKEIYERVVTGSPLFNKMEIADICWYLLARTTGKGCIYTSGMLFIEDPNYVLFNAMAKYGYPRAFVPLQSLSKKVSLPPSWSIGSTHLAEYIDYCARNTTWALPEANVPVIMANNRQGIGYDQVGIDIQSNSDDGYSQLPWGKGHVLIGKVPLKFISMNQYMFIKLENYGTDKPTDMFLHAIRFGIYLSADKHATNTRREDIDMSIYSEFREIFDYIILKDLMTHINSFFTKNLPRDIIEKLFPIYQRIYQLLCSRTFLDPFCDHIDIRFGREVIMDKQELASTQYLNIPTTNSNIILPQLSRPRGYSDGSLTNVTSSFVDDVCIPFTPTLDEIHLIV
ncbi:hypothetical protein WA158_000601 [Blastocystis sp. Blastoise]